jgi:hypothetical protein
MEEADLAEVFRKIATAFDHDHPENSDYYRWARAKILEKSETRPAFVEYVREMMEKSYGL